MGFGARSQGQVKERKTEGRIAGPFKTPVVKNLRIFLLYVVVKKLSGDFRVVHHVLFTVGGPLTAEKFRCLSF